ncbi:hypothetical protein ACIA74_40540 [Streptomyces sp. NPDC051658]|uniref:hypothetical protein n=1 Tax=Streptomyces sp. NPDC051658 TaxID=3365667 RepID=UPI0037A0472F
MKYEAHDHQLAQVHLQAAVAQAALGEFAQATARLDAVLALRGFDLLSMARATAAFVDSLTLVTGRRYRPTGIRHRRKSCVRSPGTPGTVHGSRVLLRSVAVRGIPPTRPHARTPF